MIYVFAECELDTCLYTVYRAGRLLRLRPKVYQQVLTYLLARLMHEAVHCVSSSAAFRSRIAATLRSRTTVAS